MPTLSGTFTFLIKSGVHLGPSLSMDHLKGGSATLFSMTRTETNYASVILTPTSPGGKGQDVQAAVARSETQLLKLQLNSIPAVVIQ
jgi:hypothetical protein